MTGPTASSLRFGIRSRRMSGWVDRERQAWKRAGRLPRDPAPIVDGGPENDVSRLAMRAGHSSRRWMRR